MFVPFVFVPFRRAFARTLFACVLARAVISAHAQSSEREWNQPRGNGAGTAHIDLAPVRALPVVVWKKTLGVLVCEPVAWGGVVYAAAGDKGVRKLHALALDTGEPVAKPALLPAKGPLHIAVWQGTVVATQGDGVVFYSARGDQLAPRERRVAGSFPGAPAVHAGVAYACGTVAKAANCRLETIDITQQKSLGSLGPARGRPAVIDRGHAGEVEIGAAVFKYDDEREEDVFGFAECLGWGAGTKSPTFGAPAVKMLTTTDAPVAGKSSPDDAFVGHLFPREGERAGTWFVHTPVPFHALGGKKLHTLILPFALSPIVTAPVLHDGRALGFSASGELIVFDKDGKFGLVVPKTEKLPAGARPGPATMARDVLYLGNWAVELPAGRVLWCDPALTATTPLLPLADARIVYGTAAGELVCAGDPNVKLAPAALVAGATPVRLTAPSSGDGVVLASGAHVAGAVTRLDGGRVRVAQAASEPREFAAEELALIASGTDITRVGAEHAVYSAFVAAQRQSWFDLVEKLFASWREIGCPADSQRLVTEAQAWGLAPDRAAAWSRTLTGKAATTSSNTGKQRARVAAEEDAARKRTCDAFLAASEWCEKHGLALSASALLVHAEIVLPEQARVREREAALLPRDFPGHDADARATTWSHLARAILPCGGVLVPQSDAAWERARTAPWNADAFALRTPNVILISRERDTEVLGQCLRDADRTVRLLSALLPRPAGTPAPQGVPLDVRLHASRADFLAEAARAGAEMAWASGYYSPRENVSRFYVPRGETNADPLARDLAGVLVHELTHHYISARWLGDDAHPALGDARQPGFWIVEGFARFVEDQVVEMERRGERFDDDTVRSIDAAAAVMGQGGKASLKSFLQLPQAGFAQLPADQPIFVQLRNTLGKLGITPKTLFYEQAGSLVYFLLNEAGEDRRARVF